jgi:hypothetical protein
MAIFDNSIVGFTTLTLVADNYARLVAKYGGQAFDVSFGYQGGGYFFDLAACREAREFFDKLAAELERRADAEAEDDLYADYEADYEDDCPF